MRLEIEDFNLENHEDFLNILLSSKFDEFIDWQDVPVVDLIPYFNYLYMIAEDYYLVQKFEKTGEILEKLPTNFPGKNFLHLTYLYDTDNHDELHKRCEKFISNNNNQFTKYPKHDLTFYNILSLASKSAQKMNDEDLQGGLEEQMIFFKNQLNIYVEEDGENLKGLPHHYLEIPFQEFLMVDRYRNRVFK